MRTRTEIEEQLVRDISSCQTEAAMATTIQELSLHVLLDIRELLMKVQEDTRIIRENP